MIGICKSPFPNLAWFVADMCAPRAAKPPLRRQGWL